MKVLLDRSEIYPPKSDQLGPGYTLIPGPFVLLDRANVQHIDEITSTGNRYRRYAKNIKMTVETGTDADVILRVKYITTEQETSAGITGYEVTLIERKTGQILSNLRHFFTESPFYHCPATRQGKGIHMEIVAAYMIGLPDASLESFYQEHWLPATAP